MRRKLLSNIIESDYEHPLNIKNCILYLDAKDDDTVIRIGNSVNSWQDQALGNDVYVGSSPTYNSAGYLSFSNNYLQAYNVSGFNNPSGTNIAVFNSNPIYSGNGIIQSLGFGSLWIYTFFTHVAGLYTSNHNTSNTVLLQVTPVSWNVTYIVSVIWNPSYVDMYINGTFRFRILGPIQSLAPVSSINLSIGKPWTGSFGYYSGKIMSLLSYGRDLDVDELNFVTEFLKTKHGVVY